MNAEGKYKDINAKACGCPDGGEEKKGVCCKGNFAANANGKYDDPNDCAGFRVTFDRK